MIQTKKLSKKLSKKSSKSNKKYDKIHDSDPKKITYDYLTKKYAEKEAKEKQEQEKAAIAAKKEYQRKCKIIYKHMEKVDKHLQDTVIDGFSMWVDDPKFTKLEVSREYIEDLAKADPEKYAGRQFAEFFIKSFHKTHGKEKQLMFDEDAWMTCMISVCKINKNGTIDRRGCRGANWIWRTDDFKITKFTYKFLYFIMRVIAAGHYNFAQVGGVGLNFMIRDMTRNGIKFDKILEPLNGV